MTAPQLELDRLQRWVQAVLVRPGDVDAAARDAQGPDVIEEVIEPSQALSAAQRISIYANMIELRLLDCLESDFPAVRYVLGQEDFDALLRAYLARYPSAHYSLNRLAARLPDFVSERPELVGETRATFVAELTTLERSVQEVFDEREFQPVTSEDLRGIPAEAWPGMRFEPIPALRLFAFDYPTNGFYQAFREQKRAGVPRPAPSWVAVYRRDFRIWRANLDLARFTLLTDLTHGATLAEALEHCAATPGVVPEELLQSVGPWFQEWAADGLFERLRDR